MSNRPEGAMDISSPNDTPAVDVSAVQKMLSAVCGSVVTSLLGTQLICRALEDLTFG
jgi:hypothetical protein